MYPGKDSRVVPLFEELFPFGGQLEEDNRWLRIAQLIPWKQLEAEYNAHFFPFGSAGDGRSAVPWFDSAEAPDGSERSGGGAVGSGERVSTSLLRLRGVRDGFGAGAGHADEAASSVSIKV